MGNTASRSRAGASVHTSRGAEQVEEVGRRTEGKLKETAAHEESAVRRPRNAAEESAASAAAAQRLKQSSNWSLGSLSGRLNWSFTGASRNSFHNRSRYANSRKSFSAVQQRRSKTAWHKPLTNSIFSTHFKEASRNEQFHIQHLIAKGAFGVVFKVIDKQPQRPAHEHQKPYALKVLKKSKVFKRPNIYKYSAAKESSAHNNNKYLQIIEENSVQQIKDEADIQKLCGHHPFIVQQIDLWQNRRNLHILSEFIPNGELFSKITAFSKDLIRLYLAEIGLAIDFLHNAGIIYRDAKPENILLTETFHIKLVDFGLSKWLKLGATTKTMCGTFQYMAPEILRGEPYGHAVDWWSLGIIACLMFTQKSPDVKQFLQVALPPEIAASLQIEFQDETDDIGLKKLPSTFKVQNNPSEIWASHKFLPNEVKDLPHEAADVLRRLLEIDPRQRLRSILGMQRIALYKNFKIDSKHLQSISPMDIMAKDNIAIHRADQYNESHSAVALKAFQAF